MDENKFTHLLDEIRSLQARGSVLKGTSQMHKDKGDEDTMKLNLKNDVIPF